MNSAGVALGLGAGGAAPGANAVSHLGPMLSELAHVDGVWLHVRPAPGRAGERVARRAVLCPTAAMLPATSRAAPSSREKVGIKASLLLGACRR